MQRSVYISNELWTRVRLRAVMEGTTASELVSKALEGALEEVLEGKPVADRSTVATATIERE